MLFLLRNIRRKLLTDNKVTTYLIYAVGEIILVMVGILLAVQIDNWNEGLKRDERSRDYLQRIAEDAELILKDMDDSMNGIMSNLLNSMVAKNALETRSLSLDDKQKFESFLNQYHRYAITLLQSNTYNEMLSAGEINLIGNRWIRDALSNIAANRDFVTEVNIGHHNKAIEDANHYARFVRYELLNAGTDSATVIPKYNLEVMAANETFINLISKQTLTYHGVYRMLSKHKKDILQLRDSIQVELKKYNQ